MAVTPRDQRLGEFEQLLLLAVMRLGDSAYGMTIRDEIQERTGRRVSLGAIYPTLDRLEEKALIRSERVADDSGRGGRPKRYIRLEAAGRAALQASWAEFHSMWSGFEPGVEG